MASSVGVQTRNTYIKHENMLVGSIHESGTLILLSTDAESFLSSIIYAPGHWEKANVMNDGGKV